MFQQSLGKVSRLSLKRKVPDGNGLKNCSNYHETVQIRSGNLREVTAYESKINLICIYWPTSLKLAFFLSNFFQRFGRCINVAELLLFRKFESTGVSGVDAKSIYGENHHSNTASKKIFKKITLKKLQKLQL